MPRLRLSSLEPWDLTPAFFALSYLKLYLDYHYPLGGTGTVVKKLLELINTHHGEIRTSTEIVALDFDQRCVKDASGMVHHYRRLIWAADLLTLYRLCDPAQLPEGNSGLAVVETPLLIYEPSESLAKAREKIRDQVFRERTESQVRQPPPHAGEIRIVQKAHLPMPGPGMSIAFKAVLLDKIRFLDRCLGRALLLADSDGYDFHGPSLPPIMKMPYVALELGNHLTMLP